MLTGQQRGVLRGMLSGLLITVLVMAVGLLAPPAFIQTGPDVTQAGFGNLRWLALIMACLMVAIGRLARHRFFTPEDLHGSGLTQGTETARILQAILQNTLEQVTLALPFYLLWALTLPSTWQTVIPLNATLFVLGRVLFARGYAHGASARALGFALTFYPTVAMALLLVGYWLT